MHVIQPLVELFRGPHKPLPKLVLPHRTDGIALAIDGTRRSPFDVLHHARNGERMSGPNQRVPVVRHQHEAAKLEPQFVPSFTDGRDNQIQLASFEWRHPPAKIDRNKEYPVRNSQTANTRQAPMLPRPFLERTHGTKSGAMATGFFEPA